MSSNDEACAHFLRTFEDPERASTYAEGVRRFVPGLDALHRIAGLLLDERAPPDARVLVLGAGGGMEMRALADTHPGWRFVGVDPAGEMLRLAERTLGADAARADLVEGYIDDAPAGPFDAAVCLLTLHFLDRAERLRTVRAIHDRLTPGAPFVAAHASFPQEEPGRTLWLQRYAAYAIASGADPAEVDRARSAVAASPTLFSPEEDEAILRAGGFSDAGLFFAALTWRGWIGHA